MGGEEDKNGGSFGLSKNEKETDEELCRGILCEDYEVRRW